MQTTFRSSGSRRAGSEWTAQIPGLLDRYELTGVRALTARARQRGLVLGAGAKDADLMGQVLDRVLMATVFPDLVDEAGLRDGVAACDDLWCLGARPSSGQIRRVIDLFLSVELPQAGDDPPGFVLVATELVKVLQPAGEDPDSSWRALLRSRPKVAAALLEAEAPTAQERTARPRL